MRLISILVFIGLPVSVYCENNRIALVIGNDNYQHVADLNNAVLDANTVAATLRKVGFDVQLRTNLTYRDFFEAIHEFEDSITASGPATDVLFYYSGHGVQSSGKNFLVPIDARVQTERDLTVKTISADQIMASVDRSKSIKIVIFDACRNNPFKGFTRGTVNGLAPMNAPRGTIIGYSTAPGELALDGRPGSNSPYTLHLAKNISTPGLTLERVFKQTRVAVKNATEDQQIPWEQTSLLGDDFYFLSVPLRDNPENINTSFNNASLPTIFSHQDNQTNTLEQPKRNQWGTNFLEYPVIDITNVLLQAKSVIIEHIDRKAFGSPLFKDQLTDVLNSNNASKVGEALLKGRFNSGCKNSPEKHDLEWRSTYRPLFGPKKHWVFGCYGITNGSELTFFCDECTRGKTEATLILDRPFPEIARDLFVYQAYQAKNVDPRDRAMAKGQLAQMVWFGIGGFEQDLERAADLMLEADIRYPYGLREAFVRWAQTIMVDSGSAPKLTIDGACGPDTETALLSTVNETCLNLTKDVVIGMAVEFGSTGHYDGQKHR